jgi:hypothetical protein
MRCSIFCRSARVRWKLAGAGRLHTVSSLGGFSAVLMMVAVAGIVGAVVSGGISE